MPNLPKLAIFFGILMIILGITGFGASGSHAPTALIPAALGALLTVLGMVALRNPWLAKHAMHGAAALAALGLLGGAGRALPNISKITSNQLGNPGITAPNTLGGANTTTDNLNAPGSSWTGTTGSMGVDNLNANMSHDHLVAFWMQTAMALLSLLFLIFCIKSFLDARNDRDRTSTSPPYRVP